MSQKIRIFGLNEEGLYKTKLFECELEKSEEAYAYAQKMEGLGLDVQLIFPSTPESLAVALGENDETCSQIREEIEHEIEAHNDDFREGSCCYRPSASETSVDPAKKS